MRFAPEMCWEDASAYAPVMTGGRSALAWELLRRNHGYQAAVGGLGGMADTPAPVAFVARWGLHFR